jgi:hypothetical protein
MNIGFYLLDVDMSEKCKIILQAINDYCKNNRQNNVVLFNNQFNAVDLDPQYYILHLNQAKFFKGLLFVFGTKPALLTNSFPCAKKQIIYMTEPEWSAHPELPFTVWSNIYLNDSTELLTDNLDTYNLMNICWKKPLSLIKSFDAEAINNVIQSL